MPVFLEDPSQFSKERLKSELIAHNVALPSSESKKHDYLELYLENVDAKNAADFSSDDDEEQPVQVASQGEQGNNPDMEDLSRLSDEDLKRRLLQHGFQAGPITATTRYVYEKKLRRLIEPQSQDGSGDAGDEVMYSDCEEEGPEQPESVTSAKDTSDNGVTTFLAASLPVPQDPEKCIADVLMEMFPEMERTPTGITATRRRPIKGAAGRPVSKHLDRPLIPNTADKQEVQRGQVPLWVQLLVFVVLTLLLYVTFLAVGLVLDSLNQVAEAVEEQLAAPSAEDAPLMADAAGPTLSEK